MLPIHKVHNDASILSDVFILSINKEIVFLTLDSLDSILKVSYR
jgi:hypothetical protein